MKLSIIVPIYNTEKYLADCLDSILKRIPKGVEVILVNNKSTDSSPKIIAKYAEKYPKIIKACNQDKRAGLVPTRNYGLKKAKGDYIWFIDSDDEIAEDALELILEKIESNPDLITFGRLQDYFDGTSREFSAIGPDDPDWHNRYIMYGFGFCQVCFKREFYLKNMDPTPDLDEYHKLIEESDEKLASFIAPWLMDDYVIHEDMSSMSSAVLYTDNVASINKPLYIYHARPGSILHKTGFNVHAFDIFPAMSNLISRFEKAGRFEKDHDALEYFVIWNLLLDSATDFKKHPDGAKGFKEIRRMMKTYFPKWRQNRYFKKRSLRMRLRCILNYYCIK
ncbi:MAG: glycosyltransferase family 2 protein [Candidatus Saccharibacteria bacterium]|nr:glycosyltransferase family 2 protein [Candidatus Saccharibacteria bacterium]